METREYQEAMVEVFRNFDKDYNISVSIQPIASEKGRQIILKNTHDAVMEVVPINDFQELQKESKDNIKVVLVGIRDTVLVRQGLK